MTDASVRSPASRVISWFGLLHVGELRRVGGEDRVGAVRAGAPDALLVGLRDVVEPRRRAGLPPPVRLRPVARRPKTEDRRPGSGPMARPSPRSARARPYGPRYARHMLCHAIAKPERHGSIAGTSDPSCVSVRRCGRACGRPDRIECLEVDLVLTDGVVAPRQPNPWPVPRDVGADRVAFCDGRAWPVSASGPRESERSRRKIDLLVGVHRVEPGDRYAVRGAEVWIVDEKPSSGVRRVTGLRTSSSAR